MAQTEKTITVEDWFEKNKFKAESFASIKRLIELKKRKKETISLVIPTLNEEERVGEIIETIKSKLIKQHPLIDEIVVVDSGSTDNTQTIVEKQGVQFYRASDILKRYKKYPPQQGKGENLWRSLCVTKGSILVFVDGDIKNMHHRFVYSLIGPLLTHKKLKLVKSFFERPIQKNGEAEPLGGGRVTEILVRPLLNMFFPRLTGFIQPLSGQIAARRSALEKMPFFTGYGFDLGLLIDTIKTFGLESVGQVGLGKLLHRHHTLSSLSTKAFSVLQVFSQRAEVLGKMIMPEEMRKQYAVVERKEDETKVQYQLQRKIVSEMERPPIITINKYRRLFNKNGPEKQK